MKKRYAVLAILVVLSGAGWYLARGTKPVEATPPAVPVEAVKVVLKDVPLYVSGLGTVMPLQTVTVRAQVDGQIVAVRFREGQHVRANDVLVELDPRYLQARVKEADGQLKHDQVLLANAARDLARYREALNTGTVTQQLIDTQTAAVAQDKATVLADEGAVEEARVKLGYCTIRSPVTGIAGLRQVDAGNLVQTTDTGGIVTIVSMAPIAVVFTAPQKDVARVTKALRRTGDVPVTALDADNSSVLATGAMEAIDNVVDPATGTIKLKAVFENGTAALFPGEFVHARMRVGVLQQAPVVPSQAVLRGAKGDFVFVVEKGGTAKLVRVHPDTESHGETALAGGDLKAGELVITDGSARVSDHAAVTVQLAAAPRQGSDDVAARGAAARAAPAQPASAASAADGAGINAAASS